MFLAFVSIVSFQFFPSPSFTSIFSCMNLINGLVNGFRIERWIVENTKQLATSISVRTLYRAYTHSRIESIVWCEHQHETPTNWIGRFERNKKTETETERTHRKLVTNFTRNCNKSLIIFFSASFTWFGCCLEWGRYLCPTHQLFYFQVLCFCPPFLHWQFGCRLSQNYSWNLNSGTH